MLRKIVPIFAILLFVFAAQNSAAAFEMSDNALLFIPEDATVVMALDMDEVWKYGEDVGDGWRDADVARFFDSIEMISEMLTLETGKPDVSQFFEHLSGVQAFYMEPGMDFPLMVFSTDSRRDSDVLAGYTISCLMEMKFSESLDELNSALRDYSNRTEVDEETGEEVRLGGYPETLDELIEGGYLDEIPINPYTGAPMTIVESPDQEVLGGIYYMPRTSRYNCCGSDCDSDEDDEEEYTSYILKSWHISGVLTKDGWEKSFEQYSDTDTRMRSLLRNFTPGAHYDSPDTENGFTFLGHEDDEYAFAYGDNYLLFGHDIDELKASVIRYTAGDGFEFDIADDFNIDGAFYIEQTDFPALYEEFGPFPMMVLEQSEASELGLDDEVLSMIGGIYAKMGFDELGLNYRACWLEDSNIVSVERMEFTGAADGTVINSMFTSEPEMLFTAEGGPFGIIGEIAWANPDDFLEAYVEFIFESVFPLITQEIGMEGMDPNAMLGMVGLNNLEEMEFGEQVYILFTESSERSNGMYIPGFTAILKNTDPDVGYTAVGIMDTLSFMVPEFPFTQMESDLDNVFTWTLDMEDCPISPTIGWTDGWFVKGMFREDVITALDALDNGTMFIPDSLQDANSRTHFNRQELMRGLADLAYLVPEDESPLIAGAFELMALLSNPDEHLYIETIHGDTYYEIRSELSIGMFEDLVPLLTYIVMGAEAID